MQIIHGVILMGRKHSKRKTKPKNKQKTKPTQTKEPTTQNELTAENIIRLKLTTRKGTRIESVPLNKLKKVATKKKLSWKVEDEWLILYGF